MRNVVSKLLFGLFVALGFIQQASAVVTPIDVTTVTDNIAAASTPIGLIGAATLVVLVGIKVYKWVRRAM